VELRPAAEALTRQRQIGATFQSGTHVDKGLTNATFLASTGKDPAALA
jgi:hypothetical protein